MSDCREEAANGPIRQPGSSTGWIRQPCALLSIRKQKLHALGSQEAATGAPTALGSQEATLREPESQVQRRGERSFGGARLPDFDGLTLAHLPKTP